MLQKNNYYLYFQNFITKNLIEIKDDNFYCRKININIFATDFERPGSSVGRASPF